MNQFTGKQPGAGHMMKKTLFVILIGAGVLLTNSCSKSKGEDTPASNNGLQAIDHTNYTMQDISNKLALFPDYDEFDYHDFLTELNKHGVTGAPYLIANEVVTYSSADNQGKKISLSGLLVYPYKISGKISAPILSFNHATQIMKKLAPSGWKNASWEEYKRYPEALLANIMASVYGWIIIMPDYQGMGQDVSEMHPFCVRDRLAVATADMVQGAIASLGSTASQYVTWNGQVFLMGYSEGGFVTMAAQRELEARNVTLKGVVCMEGPYDLTGAMLPVMLADSAFPQPYFLPMTIAGYNAIYPNSFTYNVVLKEPYLTNLPKYSTGFYNDSVVNSYMPANKVLKGIFTDAFIDTLGNQGSLAFNIFSANNSFTGWTPKSLMYLWHCVNDDCVPFSNYQSARKRFDEMGLINIVYYEFPSLTPDPAKGTIHQRVAPIAFLEGSLWIFAHQ